ncbi:MAG: ribosome biogenesis GTPase Der [Gammaproteobacteria bacterium]|nr:ribosome biogenesis GTPase Der [Gammaproteobacteria bacterium]MYF37827.1 ribosome biogenesis GTPase Der [Gammaproteobacteria bacterium]
MIATRTGVVALVGRPNVGKSTLFNRLCRNRDALVLDRPGLTRDRQYGRALGISDADVTLIDTGGLHDSLAISAAIDDQVMLAVEEADLVVFVVSARENLTPIDLEIASELRKSNTKVLLAVNKIDGIRGGSEFGVSEFSQLGFNPVCAISSTHGEGMHQLVETLVAQLPLLEPSHTQDATNNISVAVIGRPNVGKSSLVNALSDDNRCLVFDEPGTTRDAVRVSIEKDDQTYDFFDTAGIRRKGKTTDVVEKFSIVKALDALRRCQTALLVIDASEGLVEQDLHLIDYAIEAGTAVVLVANKWDKLDSPARLKCQEQIGRKLRFANWISVKYVSALKKTGIATLFDYVKVLYERGDFEVSTPELNEILQKITFAHPPPVSQRRLIRLRYAHKVGSRPPTILIHGNQTDRLSAGYVRYLENEFRSVLDLAGWPIVINFKNSTNPFAGRKNELTPRQQKRRARLVRHRKRR